MSAYREFASSRELHPVVACRWMRVVPEGSPSNSTLILPDGCVDLLWRDGELVLAGPDRRARLAPISPGEVIRGVRLRPGVAGAVIEMPASEVLDGHFPLPEALGTKATAIAERLGESGDDAAFELLEAVVSSQLRERGPDPLVLAASRRLGFPGSRVECLADALGISERQLRRRFHRFVGYGPKTLDRILRFRRLVSRSPAIRSGDGDLARLAADLGYADQAHMTRDCVALSDLTPGRLAATWAP